MKRLLLSVLLALFHSPLAKAVLTQSLQTQAQYRLLGRWVCESYCKCHLGRFGSGMTFTLIGGSE